MHKKSLTLPASCSSCRYYTSAQRQRPDPGYPGRKKAVAVAFCALSGVETCALLAGCPLRQNVHELPAHRRDE